MSPEIIAIAAGMIIIWLIFTWIVKVLKASISTAFAIGLLLAILQFLFGIHYQQIWQKTNQIIQQFILQ